MKGLGRTVVVDSSMFNLMVITGDFRYELKLNDTCECIKKYLSRGMVFVACHD